MTANLRNIPLFSGLQEEGLRAISDHAVIKTFPKNTIVIHEGELADSLYVILSGKVKVYLSDDKGKEIDLAVQGPGEYFGEMGLDDGPRSASVMTLEPCTFSTIGKSVLKDFLAKNPPIAMSIIQGLVKRLRAADAIIGNLALLDVYGRVARTLLKLAREENGKLVITQKLTQQDLANMVGASREMINRILRDLKSGGYIRTEGKKIVITTKPPPGW